MTKSIFAFLTGFMMILVLTVSCVSKREASKQTDPVIGQSADTTRLQVSENVSISSASMQTDAVSGPTNRYPLQVVPPVIIYKTKANYNTQVPVGLSPDKKSLLSYPAVQDVYYQGALALPTLLLNGYLLDNRGIDTNSVFLKYTYETYSALTETPLPEEILKNILDYNPLEVLYSCNCGRDTALLNEMIRRNDFYYCVKLK